MFRLLFSLNGVPPHPSTMLLVGHSVVGVHSVRAFIKRVEQFSHLRYFIIGVNLLLPEPRAVLIKWVSKITILESTILFDTSSYILPICGPNTLRTSVPDIHRLGRN